MILEPRLLKQYRDQLAESIRKGDYDEAVRLSGHISEGRIAQIILNAEQEQVLPFLEKLPPLKAGLVFSLLPSELAAELFSEFGIERSSAILDDMPVDSAAEVLYHLPEHYTQLLLNSLKPELREDINELRVFDQDQVGSHMNPAFIGVPAGTTIEETLAAIQDAPTRIENRSYIYVMSEDRRLLGVVSVKDLIRGKSGDLIESLMNPDVVAVYAVDDVLEASQLIRNRRVQMLPVLNEQEEMMGVLLLDDAIRILSRNLADQFTHIGAASSDESFYTPPLGSVKKRLPWMAGNVFLNLGAVAVISAFEGTIEAVAALAVFLPMITDMGGNVGIQALSVSIRSIALGEVRLTEYWRATRKEIVVGLINGLALGVLFAILATMLRGSPTLGLVAGAALGVNVFVAGIVGGTLPFFFKRLGYDPAMVTGPVLTTITDITGVSIYLGLSTIFLASLLVG